MILDILYDSVYVTDLYYQREWDAAFKEVEKIEPSRLKLELLSLEDTEYEMIDQYDYSVQRSMCCYEDTTHLLLELWKIQIRLEMVRERYQLYSLGSFLCKPVEIAATAAPIQNEMKDDDDPMADLTKSLSGVGLQ